MFKERVFVSMMTIVKRRKVNRFDFAGRTRGRGANARRRDRFEERRYREKLPFFERFHSETSMMRRELELVVGSKDFLQEGSGGGDDRVDGVTL